MSNELKPLEIPDSIFEDQETDAIEFVRFWICNQSDHVTLNIGGADADAEVEMWGNIVADIASHAVRGMQQDDPSRGSAEQMLAEIERVFCERLKKERSLSGQLKATNQ
jgi:hypothetical protein